MAFPLGMFSAEATRATAGRRTSRRARARRAPSTAAPPAMSSFMAHIPSPGLIEMPPLSKVIPFPQSTTGGPSAPSGRCSTMMKRAGSSEPWATPRRAPIFSSAISSGPSTWQRRPARARHLLRGGGEGARGEVVAGAGDQVAGEAGALGQDAPPAQPLLDLRQAGLVQLHHRDPLYVRAGRCPRPRLLRRGPRRPLGGPGGGRRPLQLVEAVEAQQAPLGQGLGGLAGGQAPAAGPVQHGGHLPAPPGPAPGAPAAPAAWRARSRVSSSRFPSPTRRTRVAVSAPPAGGYSTAVWLSLPVKSRESISRLMAPPRASSSAPRGPGGLGDALQQVDHDRVRRRPRAAARLAR